MGVNISRNFSSQEVELYIHFSEGLGGGGVSKRGEVGEDRVVKLLSSHTHTW